MGKAGQKFGKISGAAKERLASFLRRKHPVKTAEEVAAFSGCEADSVRKWLDGVAAPSCIPMVRLISAYGPEFLAALMERPPLWIDAAWRAEERARLVAEQDRIALQLARLGDG